MKQINNMSIRFKLLLTIILAVPASVLMSQTISSAYFLDGSFDRHRMNPALTPERGYLSLPVVGGMNFDLQGNVGLSNFLYESKTDPGMLTTFMSSEISRQQFLNALPDITSFRVGMNLDILSLGIRAFGGYTTLGISLSNRESVNIPKEMFAFMKAGLSDGNYLINNLNVNTMSYLEGAIGHSRPITENLTIGLKFKYLVGVAYADVNIDQMKAKISENGWVVNANATMQAAAPGIVITEDSETGYVDGVETEFSEEVIYEGLKSTGFAIDLGAYYDMSDLVSGLTLSASVTDIGSIKWKGVVTAETDNQDIVFDGFNDYDVMGGSEDDTFEKLGEDFSEMLNMYQKPAQDKKVNLGATFRLGAEYELPFAQWISVGELFTYRAGIYKYTESRTALVLSPTKWFELSGNVAFTSTYGTTLGFMLNFHPALLNIFVATDGIKATLNPQFIPTESFGTNLLVGVKFPVGARINR